MAGGRPKKTIDYVLVESLANIMCTQEEIANILSKKCEISVRTLQRDEEFCRVYKRGLDNAKSSLRKAQFKNAIDNNNATMQIWLGRNYLGQKDNFVEENNDISKLDEILKEVKENAIK